MSTTPRPWSADSQWWAGSATPLKYAHIKGGETVLASAVNEEDADLIVTAVNEHDALVAFVEAMRGLDVDAPMIPTAQVRRVLATLDAALGDQA